MEEGGEGEKAAFCYLIAKKQKTWLNTVLQYVIIVVAVVLQFMNMESY